MRIYDVNDKFTLGNLSTEQLNTLKQYFIMEGDNLCYKECNIKDTLSWKTIYCRYTSYTLSKGHSGEWVVTSKDPCSERFLSEIFDFWEFLCERIAPQIGISISGSSFFEGDIVGFLTIKDNVLEYDSTEANVGAIIWSSNHLYYTKETLLKKLKKLKGKKLEEFVASLS